MLKDDYIETSKVKKPFKFTYIKPLLDWYEDVNVSITYDEYCCLTLERRYSGSWWLLGHKYIKDKDKWVEEQIGEIREKDIPRLVEWAENTNRFGHQVSILTEIRTIDGCLNPIKEFLRIMEKYKTEIEPQESEDAISREAVIEHICESKECYKDECKGRLYKRCYDLQWIYALPSVTPKQPFINKPCISEGVCHEDKVNVLNKIIAEIMQLDYDLESVNYDYDDMVQTEEVHMICREEVLHIIDEYKTESENKK